MENFRARYCDGRTAESRAVIVRADGEGIRIFEATDSHPARGGIGFAYWPYRALRTIGPVRPGLPVHLAISGPDMQRLTVDDLSFAAYLQRVAPRFLKGRLRSDTSPGRTSLGSALKWTAGGVGLVAALAVFWFYLPETAARLIPRSWETALGQQAVEQVAQFFGGDRVEWCDTADGSAAIQNLTRTLAAAAGSDINFRVRVLKSSTLNAFAVPGDQIVLIKGLIDFAKHPDEVAGVLAHEMAHVIRRHPTQNMVRAQGLRAITGTILGGDTSGDLLVAAGEVLVLLKYGRDAEQEADGIARGILTRAGIGIGGLNRFFRRLESRNGGSSGASAFLSTHPPLPGRIATAPAGAAASRPAMTPAQWRAVQTMCR